MANDDQPVFFINARTYLKAWRTKAEPVLLKCEDGHDYVVKGQGAGRQIVNDQLVARLGELLQAPVGKPAIIYIYQELIEIEPKLQGFVAGTAHGVRWIPDCRDEYTLIATSEPLNRSRLVLLATLYGWTQANDHQFLFSSHPPRLIHSVDHGHFFPNPPNWSVNDLFNSPPARLDAYFTDCHFSAKELNHARCQLKAIDANRISQAVFTIPEDWGITIKEKSAMKTYLIERQQALLDNLSLS